MNAIGHQRRIPGHPEAVRSVGGKHHRHACADLDVVGLSVDPGLTGAFKNRDDLDIWMGVVRRRVTGGDVWMPQRTGVEPASSPTSV